MYLVIYLPSSSHLQRISIALHKVGILPRPAVHLKIERQLSDTAIWGMKPYNQTNFSTNLDLRTEAEEERLSCAVAVFAHSEGMSGESPKYLPEESESV